MHGAASRSTQAAEFDDFFAGSASVVLRRLFLITGDAGEAEDITQEAFERAWLRWSTVRACDSPEAWVMTVARRLAVSRWRRARSTSSAWLRRGDEPASGDDGSTHVALVAALRRLPVKQRVAVVLFHLADRTVEQVSAETGDSVSAVKQQLVRGRTTLATLLADDWAGPPRAAQDMKRRTRS